MQIRDYQQADLAAVAELFTAAVHELAVGCYDDEQRRAWAPRPPDLAHWRRRLAGRQVLVAEDGGELAGFLSHGLDGHIDMLFTAPRCARRGVALTAARRRRPHPAGARCARVVHRGE